MLNPLRPAMTRLFTPVGKILARTPVTPNAVTVIGTVGVAGGALGLFPIGELFPGAFTCTIFVFLDMLDGVLARIRGTSGTWGAFLDSTMDRIADAGLSERPERMLISLIAVGVSGLGVPYILNVGLWALAVGSAFTFWQRMHAVYKAAKAPGEEGGPPGEQQG